MPAWHPITEPHTSHNAPRYWHGVTTAVAHSNFEQPRVSVRQTPSLGIDEQTPPPPAWQPPVTASATISTPPEDQSWRAD